MTQTELLDLAPELITHIVSFLGKEDVRAARATCKAVEEASLAHFGERCFRKKGFMITTPSLNVLLEIANHNELKKHVQHVWFNPDCFTFVEMEPPVPRQSTHKKSREGGHGRNDNRQSTSLSGPVVAFNDCKRDHRNLLHGHPDHLQRLLVAAFEQLPNLKIVGMRRSEKYSPWGWEKLQEAIRYDPRVIGPVSYEPQARLSDTTQLFVAIIRAVATSGITLRRLYTDAIEIDNVPVARLPESMLTQAGNPIWYLEFNLVRAWLKPQKNPDHNDFTEDLEFGEGVVRFLQTMTSLKEFSLQTLDQFYHGTHNPFWWLGIHPYVVFQKLARDVQLPNLTRIKLERIIATHQAMLAFFKPSAPTLTSFKLRDVRLVPSQDDSETNIRPWYHLFNFLRESCLKLAYLLLYNLMHAGGGISFVEDLAGAPPPSATTDAVPELPWNEVVGAESNAYFRMYEHIALEVRGVEKVKAKLDQIAESHWYQGRMFSYEIDDALWHTDTSDEEA